MPVIIRNRNEFLQAVKQFLRDVENCPVETQWHLSIHPKTRYAYIWRKQLVQMPVINQQESDWDIDLPEHVHDPADANPLAAANIYTLEHHIVYSPSYQVPVLYFNVYDSSGSVLPWEQVDRFLRVARGSLSSQQAIISQTEHPILGLPFFYIHPCETQRLLKTLAIQQLTTSNFIKVWLSFIGPEAFCNISFRLFSGKQTE